MTASRFDLSLGQRLTAGFGVLLLILIVLIAFVFDRQNRSSEAQRVFVEEIARRTELTRVLQDDVLSLAIAVRSYLLTPDGARLERYMDAKDRVRAARQRLIDAQDPAAPSAADGAFGSLVERYVQTVERLVDNRPGSGITPAQELELARAREAAVTALHQIITREREDTAQALDAMTVARASVQYALVGTSVLMIVCFVGLASATTRAVAVPARELVQVAAALERGDWQPALALAPADVSIPQPRRRDEMRILGRAFGAAATALERRAQRLRAEGDIASVAASTLDKTVLADRVLRAMIGHLRADVGVVYLTTEGQGELAPVAQYALDSRVTAVRVGEGIVGQAAKDGRAVTVRDIPNDSPFVVRFGYDQAPARAVVAVPLRFGDVVHGVAVVGSLRDLDGEALSFVEAAGAQLGVGLQNATSHEQIERLLADVRESNEQLQAQSEELQAQNEEIQAQNEEIQAQNEEIQSQNEELQAQAEELHAQHDEIQRRSHEVEQHSAQLQRQAALLREADERKNEFLGLLAHELRNPLAPMTVSLFILKQTPPGSERALHAQAVIERQVQHLSRLTDDLLDVTRISHGKIQLSREPLDLGEVVRSCVEDHQGTVAAKALVVDVELPRQPLWVDGDRTRLCQVLNNLLSNAAKFTDSGGRLRVSVREEAQEAVLDVIDTGSGIEPALLQQIFEPFTQGVTNLARASGGLGLGLALVKALVEMHEGTVQAHSNGAGTGSRFTIRLPLRPAAVLVQHATQPHTHLDSRRILIVEDNKDAAGTLTVALEMQGHFVDVAQTGPEGLGKARALVPDVVLCDIGLPGMDGYTIARTLRADERFQSTMLVAVSGYAAEHDRARAAEAGFDHHLAKPVMMERLVELLADHEVSRLRADS